jgi:nucleotide-binding universal stress UspA family protein
MYKHILLAADGSKNSIRAAKEAVRLAGAMPDSLIEVVYVVDFNKAKNEVLHANSVESLELERRAKLVSIEKLIKEANIKVKITILKGTPGPEIVRYANEKSVDLVVIGSRGLNGFQEMVLGSVSHKVMKRVTCPALIVK